MDTVSLRDAITLISLMFSQVAIVLSVVACFLAKGKGKPEREEFVTLEVEDDSEEKELEKKVQEALARFPATDSYDELESRFKEMQDV